LTQESFGADDNSKCSWQRITVV